MDSSSANTFRRALCNECSNDPGGLCCPPTVECDGGGHCPQEALKAAGYMIDGEDIADINNTTGVFNYTEVANTTGSTS